MFGLTGGIGSGKSTVAAIWRNLGLPVVDADVLAREVVAPGSPGLALLQSTFGPSVVAADGSLDRAAMGRMAFSEPAAREKLEAVLNPLIGKAAQSQFTGLRAAGHPLIAYDVPLLFETGQVELYRPVVVVFTDEPTRRRRIVARDNTSEDEARRRISAQAPLEEKAALADYVIDNSGSIEQTERQARNVLSKVRASLTGSANAPL